MKKLSSLAFVLLLCLIVPLAALGGGEKESITVTETKATSSCVAFKWKKVRSADFYRVLRLEKGKYKAVLQTTEPAGTVQGLKSNKSYAFKVRAYKKSGGKNQIISLCQKITVRTKIRAAELKTESVDKSSVSISWTASPGAAEYRVAARTAPGGKYKAVSVTKNTGFTYSGMTNGQYVRIRVQAVNKINTGEYSFITLYSAPGKVSGLKVKSTSYNGVSLSWSKVKNATGYEVYASRKKNSGYSKKAEVKSAKARVSLKDDNTRYYFKVRAVIKTKAQSTAGAYSGAVSAKTKSRPFLSRGERFVVNPQRSEWNLIVVNRTRELPEGYTPKLKQILGSGKYLDYRVAPYYEKMYYAAKKDGVTLTPYSAYRSYERQKINYDNLTATYMSRYGLSKSQAQDKAATVILPPGTSEHNLGFAVDICNTSSSFKYSSEYKWLTEHAHEYGFILRYTAEKQSVTGIIPEPWHWRYVGVEHAGKIRSSGLCLEEYLDSIGVLY